jgi:5-formyltetrahydrofolate cyclo-ligase
MTDRERLRTEMRKRRRRLAQPERDDCAARLAQLAAREPLVSNSRRIAAYFPVNGEMDPRPLMDYLWSMDKTLYLPVLVNFSQRRLWFSVYTPGDPLVCNRFGIPEPARVHGTRIKTAALDLVLLPLVAFDAMGHRLGMGGGYYDHCFEFINRRVHWRKPRLVGLAYEFQRLPLIKPEPWDVPLDAIATEQGVYHC